MPDDALELDVIDAPVRHDDEVGREVRGVRFDEDVGLGSWRRARAGVADDPACRVAGRDREQRFARFERDVGDALGRGLDRVERAALVGELVQRADERGVGWRRGSRPGWSAADGGGFVWAMAGRGEAEGREGWRLERRARVIAGDPGTRLKAWT